MRKLYSFCITLIIALTSAIPASALTAEEAFIGASDAMLPMLSVNERMDMVDYYKNGLSTPVHTYVPGEGRVLEIQDNHLTFSADTTGTASRVTLAVFGEDDKAIIAMIITNFIPATDAHVELYNADFKPIKQDINPQYCDWLPDKAFDQIDDLAVTLPFVTARVVVDNRSITFVNTIDEYLSTADTETIKPWIVDSITYVYNKGKLKKRK